MTHATPEATEPQDPVALAQAVLRAQEACAAAKAEYGPNDPACGEAERTLAKAEAALVKSRLTLFQGDADDREKKLKIENPGNPDGKTDRFSESRYLAAGGPAGADSSGKPLLDIISGAVKLYTSYAVAGMPLAGLVVDPVAPWEYGLPDDNPDALDALRSVAWETADRLDKVARHDLDRCQVDDLHHKVNETAAHVGVGYLVADDGPTGRGALDWADPDVARVLGQSLRDPERAMMTASARAKALELLKDRTVLREAAPEGVYWQAGVTSALKAAANEEMTRCHNLDHRDVDGLRRAYPGKEIKPFKNVRGVQMWKRSGGSFSRNGKAEQYIAGGGQTAGVLTTWERVTRYVTRRMESAVIDPVSGRQRPKTVEESYRERWMVRTEIAGDTLLSVRVWSEQERTTILPIVPYYLLESRVNPYGIALPMQLKRHQDFLNQIKLMIYEQAESSFSNSAVAMAVKQLGATDDVEEIERKFRKGGIVPIELNDDVLGGDFDIRKFLAPLAQMTAGMTPMLKELYEITMAEFSMSAEMNDLNMMNKRSALALDKAEAIGDRPKTIMIGRQALSAESLIEVVAANWRHKRGRMVVGTQEGYITLNEPRPIRIRRMVADAYGSPVPLQHPLYADESNPEGFVWDTVVVTVGDVEATARGKADSRSPWPRDPQRKMEVFGMMAQQGIITKKTLRERTLPQAMLVTDDRHRAEEEEQQAQLKERLMNVIATAAAADLAPEAAAAGGGLEGARATMGAPMGSPESVGGMLANILATMAPKVAAMSPEEVQAELDEYEEKVMKGLPAA